MNITTIEELGNALRENMPDYISEISEGEVEQDSDETLCGFHNFAWEIRLNNGAAFQITIVQSAFADNEEEEEDF